MLLNAPPLRVTEDAVAGLDVVHGCETNEPLGVERDEHLAGPALANSSDDVERRIDTPPVEIGEDRSVQCSHTGEVRDKVSTAIALDGVELDNAWPGWKFLIN